MLRKKVPKNHMLKPKAAETCVPGKTTTLDTVRLYACVGVVCMVAAVRSVRKDMKPHHLPDSQSKPQAVHIFKITPFLVLYMRNCSFILV